MDTNDLTDNEKEILNKVVPVWARGLNWVYERTFAPLDRLFDYLSSYETRKLTGYDSRK